MKTIFTGLLLVASFGFSACISQTDDSEVDDHSEDVSLGASSNPDKNGLETYKVTHASILINQTLATSLVTHPLRIATNSAGTNGLSKSVLNALCDSTHDSLETMRYISACALASGTKIEYTCPGSTSKQTFYGRLGLAVGWGDTNGVCAEGGCQEWVSACVLAHSSFPGEMGVDLQISGTHPNMNSGHDAGYLDDEGAYWGDIFNQNGAGQKRYGCSGTNAHVNYNSPLQGGPKYLMSRTCGYFNANTSCDVCDSITAMSGNQCTGTHSHYLTNLNPASSPATVRSCANLCTSDTTINSGTYNNCTTTGTGTASSRVITVWRK